MNSRIVTANGDVEPLQLPESTSFVVGNSGAESRITLRIEDIIGGDQSIEVTYSLTNTPTIGDGFFYDPFIRLNVNESDTYTQCIYLDTNDTYSETVTSFDQPGQGSVVLELLGSHQNCDESTIIPPDSPIEIEAQYDTGNGEPPEPEPEPSGGIDPSLIALLGGGIGLALYLQSRDEN